MNANVYMPPYLLVLARRLGWDEPTRHEYVVRSPDVEVAARIIWFECGSSDDVLLQINTNPALHAGAFAVRYRICTGWHAIDPLTTEVDVAREAARLEPWLARHWFTTTADRRRFRQAHPECSGYSWKRLREEGPPHQYEPSRS